MDNLGCHSSISHSQVTIIELPPNTTAVYQPLDAGIIVLLKNRYKKRLLYRVVCNLDSLLYCTMEPPTLQLHAVGASTRGAKLTCEMRLNSLSRSGMRFLGTRSCAAG